MKDSTLFIGYHLWASHKVFNGLKDIPVDEWNKELGGSFPSISKTIQHIATADYRWLMRWKGISPYPIQEPFVFEDWNTASETHLPILDDMKQVTQQFVENGDNQLLHFTTARGDKFIMPFWQTLHHVVNHGTYHRGQITNMLRALNRQPVNTDMMLYFAEENAKQNG